MFEAAEDRAASGEPNAHAQPRLARIALRLGACARANWWPAARRGSPRPAVPDGPRQGRQGAAGADLRRAPRPRSPNGSSMSRRRPVAVPERQEASQPGAAVPDRPRAGRRRRDRARAGQPARPSPRLRHPSAVGRRGPARAPVAAWPCRHRHHPDLHPCRQRPAGRAGQRPPSARRRAVVDVGCALRPTRGPDHAQLPRFRKADRRARDPGRANCARPRPMARSTSMPKSAGSRPSPPSCCATLMPG